MRGFGVPWEFWDVGIEGFICSKVPLKICSFGA